MAIPDFQSCMLPLLELAADGKEHTLAEARGSLTQRFELNEEERRELLPSGRQRRFDNRVAWAKVYLEQAGLLSSSRRAHFLITDQGRSLLTESPTRIDIHVLERFAEFREFRNASRTAERSTGTVIPDETPVATATPEEMLETAYQSIRVELVSELLSRVKTASPRFFESLVVELLLKMGYGGNRAEAGRAIGGVGDEGLDGLSTRIASGSIRFTFRQSGGTEL
jgi:restriction system protein